MHRGIRRLGVLALFALALAPQQQADAASWNESVLYSFLGPPGDGAYPRSSLIFDSSGNFFGTTNDGGSGNGKLCGGRFGCGVLYRLAPGGSESILYAWCSDGAQQCDDGAVPVGDIVRDAAGNIYGATALGGSCSSCGTVFRLAPDGTQTILHSFDCESLPCRDGSGPQAGLIRGGKKLYGTTHDGGANGFGTVYSMSLAGKEKILYSFCQDPDPVTSVCRDGAYPAATLTRDAFGNLYGTTVAGGNPACSGSLGLGCGTVFRISRKGSYSVLYRLASGTDGAMPSTNVVMDSKGNLYGGTLLGGAGCSSNDAGCGVIFKIAADGTESIVHSFSDEPDGREPLGDLIINGADEIFGVTEQGGTAGEGTAFRISPKGRPALLYSFCSLASCADGYAPFAGLTLFKGDIYGTATSGGAPFWGVVFKLAK